jgi:alpha-galactosidase
LASALAYAHASGAAVRDQSKPGTGITLDRPLRYDHEMNAVVRGGGTGITLTKPVTMEHPLGEQVGASGMTVDEARTHMSLWAMMASPLVAGADIPNMAKENLDIYLNRDVIAIDQDPLGIQAFTVSNAGNHWIFRKPLANGDVAVAFWNDTTSQWTEAGATFAQLELDAAATYSAKDLWSKQISKLSGGTVTIGPVPEHGTVVLRIAKPR